MKKTIFVLLAVICFAAVASAQPKAIGVRFGWGADVSYEHNIGAASNFLEFEGGLDGFDGGYFHVEGVYNFMIAEPEWTNSGNWGFYAGPGAGASLWVYDGGSSVYFGLLGNVGLEYTFKFPLQLSVDLRPRFMFGDGGFWNAGLFSCGVSARYAF